MPTVPPLQHSDNMRTVIDNLHATNVLSTRNYNRTGRTKVQYVRSFSFTEISGRFHKYFDSAYAILTLDKCVPTHTSEWQTLVTRLPRSLEWSTIISSSPSVIKFGTAVVQTRSGALHFEGAMHMPNGATTDASVPSVHFERSAVWLLFATQATVMVLLAPDLRRQEASSP